MAIARTGTASGRRWARVLGIPVMPLDRTGEHLRCTICRTCYRVELLAVPTMEQMQAALVDATTAAVLAMLNAGGSASQAARRSAIQLILGAGSPDFTEADLAAGLRRARSAQQALIACGPVPGLRYSVETLAIQLETHAQRVVPRQRSCGSAWPTARSAPPSARWSAPSPATWA